MKPKIILFLSGTLIGVAFVATLLVPARACPASFTFLGYKRPASGGIQASFQLTNHTKASFLWFRLSAHGKKPAQLQRGEVLESHGRIEFNESAPSDVDSWRVDVALVQFRLRPDWQRSVIKALRRVGVRIPLDRQCRWVLKGPQLGGEHER
jgi:hypothetical protein